MGEGEVLGGVGGDSGGEGVGDGDDDFSDGVDGAGEMLAWYLTCCCPLCSLLHYLITLQCTALQCVSLSTL